MIHEYPATSRHVALEAERSGIKNIGSEMNPSSEHRISLRRRKVVRTNALMALLVLVRLAISIPIMVDAESADPPLSSNPSSSSPVIPIRLKGDPFDADWGDLDATTIDQGGDNSIPGKNGSRYWGSAFYGFGREFSLFDTGPRGGARNENNNDYSYDDYSTDSDGGGGGGGIYSEDEDDNNFFTRMERYREQRKSISSVSSNGYNNEEHALPRSFMPWQSQRRKRRQQQETPEIVQKVQHWWMKKIDPTLQSLPKMMCRIEPSTTLKLRKTFRPLKTIVRLGADYNTQQGIWQFKSSWEDAIIGGKITLAGSKELQLTKSWQMSVGGVEDLVTRLRFRATINLQTFQAYARVGFRTERLTPIDVVEGFTVLKRLPLDGSGGNIKLEVKANVALPEPEIEYSTEAQRSVIGMGNIEVSIDEMNVLLDY